MLDDWNIKGRADACSITQRPFAEGERFWSALYWHDGQYERLDYCQDAWEQRNDNLQPLSAWQSEFELPPPAAPEALRKDDAESLLRRLMQENDPATRNSRYILTLMLERKRLLKPIDRQQNGDTAILIYEHLASGETWIIEDPKLKLMELEPVQEEVSALLTARTVSEAAQPAAPETEAAAAVPEDKPQT
jgi:hypothetical protein